MDKVDLKQVVEKLLAQAENEEIGVNLLTTFYQRDEELAFFPPEEHRKVVRILKTLASDSKKHRRHLKHMIIRLSRGVS